MLDPALDTLLLPFAEGELAWPETGRILFLRARHGLALNAAPRERLLCRQSYLPFAQALSAAKFTLDQAADTPAGPFPLILLLPPRQRDEARGLLAEAVALTNPGSLVVAALPNSEGARSVEDDLATLAGPVHSRSKNKCRVFWTRIDPARVDAPRRADWQALTQPRLITDAGFPGGSFWSRPGLFAWDRIDAGSALLAQHLPADLGGHGADLGCGHGYLAAMLLAQGTRVTALDLYEAEREALTLAERNLAPLAKGRPLDFFWHDVAGGLRRDYDFIISNPPFHVAREDRADLGQAFIAAAAKHLKPGGRFLLVANQHLPYERSLGTAFASQRVLSQEAGYKVIEAVKKS